jgi:hypothetical protein
LLDDGFFFWLHADEMQRFMQLFLVTMLCLCARFPSGGEPAGIRPSALPSIPLESDNAWFAAHEASGPEGTRIAPMERASWWQVGLALALLIGSGLIVNCSAEKAASSQCRKSE